MLEVTARPYYSKKESASRVGSLPERNRTLAVIEPTHTGPELQRRLFRDLRRLHWQSLDGTAFNSGEIATLTDDVVKKYLQV